MSQKLHTTVLLNEAVDALMTDESGFYIDGTFGRGGHTRLLLERLGPEAKVLGVDKDPRAIATGEQLSAEDNRFSIVHDSFAEVGKHINQPVDGILLDLGVSSPQLDEGERGFSFLRDGPLDMRMNTSAGMSAEEWLNTAEEKEISWVLKTYGEERFARRMARAIIERRQEAPLKTTGELAKLLSDANPAWEKGKHPATRSFQAIRIHINQELQDLEKALDEMLELLRPGGRLVIISFHSLEDRMVKRFIRDHARGGDLPPGLPLMESQIARRLKPVGKAIKATKEEVSDNPRSRSAVMRIAEKLV
ncbi:16S rRNA (cytosine(1402)-N(4))-methyltransferase RsmH [Endozoicomonadaceae bacterium StTr2]